MLPFTVGYQCPFNEKMKQEDVLICHSIAEYFSKSISSFERLNDGVTSSSTYWLVRLTGEGFLRIVKKDSCGEILVYRLEDVKVINKLVNCE